VATDNSPVDYKYISRRLTEEIVQQHEAAKSRSELSLGVQLRVFGMSVKTRKPDFRNLFDLARRATDAVINLTGTLEAEGLYVAGELDLHPCRFPVHMGWERSPNHEVAAYVADAVVGGERVFVGLFGSVGNYIGHREEDRLSTGFFPSDIDGLYGILNGSLEPSDPRIWQDYLDDNAQLDEMDVVEIAIRLGTLASADFRSRRLQYLAKVHIALHDVDVQSEHFDHVLIGAPVWARSPAPRVFGAPE
jgi:hypothetical protein